MQFSSSLYTQQTETLNFNPEAATYAPNGEKFKLEPLSGDELPQRLRPRQDTGTPQLRQLSQCGCEPLSNRLQLLEPATNGMEKDLEDMRSSSSHSSLSLSSAAWVKGKVHRNHISAAHFF
ncbi:aconitate hydratase, mitochondrial-like isoform X1 [Lates japonicus]|uniref:Aconitate hydratase, mitochondrial-like isoform X1 n=1 Tax=Lates japonicus TaxID=270547 RepID=A0AAD3NC70_LATJO|nr:aconitate hydratase, mitochondrial-like isoform X1 [Lates japonicus]